MLWSGICCKLFGSPNITSSSGNAECSFKIIKQSLAEVIPTSVDIFVTRHLDLLNSDVVEASQKYITLVGADPRDRINEVNDNEQQSSTLTESDDMQSDHTENEEISNNCPACKNGDAPSGAHKCIKCGKNVHIFSECSESIGDDERFGERRICKTCSISNKRKVFSPMSERETKKQKKSQESKEMNYQEQWGKKKNKRTKKSIYLQADPKWSSKTFIDPKAQKFRNLENGLIRKSLAPLTQLHK